MTARPNLAAAALEIEAWCEKHQDTDAPAWHDIALLLDGKTLLLRDGEEPEAVWKNLIGAAERALDRRRNAATARPDDPRREQRLADAYAIRNALLRSAWREGRCFDRETAAC